MKAAAEQDLWRRSALVLGWSGVLALAWAALCCVPAIYWNAPRLAPAFAIARGLNPYATRVSGAHLGWFYGPVFPLWSLPATCFGNPTIAMNCWSLLNLVAIVGPAWVVLRALVPARDLRVALLVYFILLLANSLTEFMLLSIHIDALCTGFGLLALWLLHHSAKKGGSGGVALHGAALAVSLAVWTKQIAIGLVPAMLIWCLWERKPALAGRLALWILAYAAALGLVFSRWFGAEELIFNLWLVQTRTPFKAGWADGLPAELGHLVACSWPWLAVPVILWLARRAAPPPPDDPAGGLRRLLWLAVLCFIPLGITAAMKEGGGLNSLHSLNYLLPLMAAALVGRLPLQTARGGVLLFALVILGLGNALHGISEYGPLWWPSRKQEEALHLARENPGRVYFPWNPLVTLMADGKIYPFDNALYCLVIAGLAPSTAAVKAAVPVHPLIIYEEPAQSHVVLNYLSGKQPAAPAPPAGKP